MSNTLSGKVPLAYTGTNATNPPNIFIRYRAPVSNDFQNVSIGDFWVYIVDRQTNNNQLWTLLGLVGNIANWVLLSGSSGVTTNLTGNTGGEVAPLAGNINVIGDGTTITVSGDPALHTLTISALGFGTFEGFDTQDGNTVTPTAGLINLNGGNNLTTTGTVGPNTATISLSGITQHSIQVGGASNALTQLGVATNGQLPIGSTGADPVLATLTAGNGISVTNGAGSITIATSTGSSAFQVDISAEVANVTGAGTLYQIVFNRSYYNIGSNFNTGTGLYIAPANGVYHFDCTIAIGTIGTITGAMNIAQSSFLVSGTGPCVGYWTITRNNLVTVYDGTNGTWRFNGSMTVYLNAGDTVGAIIQVENGASNTVYLESEGVTPSGTWMSGFRVI